MSKCAKSRGLKISNKSRVHEQVTVNRPGRGKYIVESDNTQQDWPPVVLLYTPRLNKSVANSTLKLVQHVLSGVGGVAHDHQQFFQLSLFNHLLQCDQMGCNDRLRHLYEFIQSVGILCCDASSPAHHSTEDDSGNNKLIEHAEHHIH